MARKKKEQAAPETGWSDRLNLEEAAVPAPPEPAPVEEALPQNLMPEELLRLKLHEAECRANQAEAQVKAYQQAQYLAQIDPTGRYQQMSQEINQQMQEVAKSRARYQAVLRLVEARLGVDMSRYGYDDETGALTLQD